MKNLLRFTAALAGLAVVLMVLPVVGPTQVHAAFGEVRMLRGKAIVVRGRIEIHVTERLELEDGDTLEVLADSKAHVALAEPLEGAEAVVTANSTVKVNEIGRSRRADRSPFRLLFGAIRSRITSFFGEQPFMVTGTATIGIKGTDFIVYVKRKNASEFIGVDGLIEAASASRPEYSLRIGARQWGEIVEGEKPKPPVRVPDDDWDAALRTFSFPN